MKSRGLGLSIVLLVVAVLMVTGCAPSIMQKTDLMKAPESGYAMVTFLRPSFVGAAIQFGI